MDGGSCPGNFDIMNSSSVTESIRMADATRVNILVVDDLPEKLLAYQTILEELGQNIITATSGPAALKQVLKHEFAVILLDVTMPGMDGLETAAMIRQRRRSAHIPIIFITAFADEVRVAEGYARGAVDYIQAPVVPEVLRAKVRVFVDLFQMAQKVKHQAEQKIALAEERSRRAAAEEANRRLSFLAKAGSVLGQSLEYDVTAEDVARLPVPFLADQVALVLIDRGGDTWKILFADQHESEVLVQRDLARQDLSEDIGQAVALTLADPPAPPMHPGAHVCAIPMQVRGRTFAVLALARCPSRPAFDVDDLTMVRDVSARAAIALENARLHEEVRLADQQKNEFLSMLAHELRNPLAPIRNAVSVMQVRSPDQPELRWARDVIDRQVEHMVRLVDDLLDISRVTRGKIRLQLEPVEMGGVLTQALEVSRPMIQARQHHLELTVPEAPVWVRGDSARLAQVITNLLQNAAKYTPEGGQIHLELSGTAGQAICRVRDDGMGIPPDMLNAIFDLFTQVDRSLDRSEGGLGIGLTLVRRLVEMHGGCVSASSDGPGQGSEFVIRLPRLAAEEVKPAPARRRTPRSGRAWQARVLIVEDNADTAESLAMLLRLDGAEVQIASDGPQALDVVAEYQPTVVLLDIGLPGMDGFELARRLRAHPSTADAFLVALTGYGQADDRSRAQEAGLDHHLVKPVDYTTLRDLLASLPAPVA